MLATLATLAAAVTTTVATPAPTQFRVDAVHSKVGFSIQYMGLASVEGRFTDFGGTILYAADDPERSSITVVIKAASIDTEFAQRDKELKGPNFFDAEKHPVIVFRSRSIQRENGALRMAGTLTMRGVTRDVSFPFTFAGTMSDQWGTRVAFEGRTNLKRSDYGILGWPTMAKVMMGDDVAVALTIVGWRGDIEKTDVTEKGKVGVADRVARSLSDKGIEAAVAEYRALKQAAPADHDLGFEQLNVLGLKLLARDRLAEAVRIFELNAEAFPNESHALARLGDAYLRTGRTDLAARSYRRALELDPYNTVALEMSRHAGTP